MNISSNEYTGAAIIDEISDDFQYVGYAQNGNPAESDAKWAIKRIQKTFTVTRIMWADGLQDKNYVWDDRGELNYLFKK